jgi:predicted esterase
LPPIEEHHFRSHLDCRYIVQTPEAEYDDSVSVVALHGYGMDAETMLRLVATWFPKYRITSLQAPHPFYKSMDAREVGYSWATHLQSEESVRLHHEILMHVLRETGAPVDKTLLMGFSQPVGLNYRFAATHPGLVRGVIGVCGGVPKDWETGSYQRVDAAVLHIARTEDEFYSPEATRKYHERLSVRADDVEYLEFPGKHRFPSLAQPAVLDWVRRKFSPCPAKP